jgi:hypothetical protein
MAWARPPRSPPAPRPRSPRRCAPPRPPARSAPARRRRLGQEEGRVEPPRLLEIRAPARERHQLVQRSSSLCSASKADSGAPRPALPQRRSSSPAGTRRSPAAKPVSSSVSRIAPIFSAASSDPSARLAARHDPAARCARPETPGAGRERHMPRPLHHQHLRRAAPALAHQHQGRGGNGRREVGAVRGTPLQGLASALDLVPRHDPDVRGNLLGAGRGAPVAGRHLLDPAHPHGIVDVPELVNVLGRGGEAQLERRSRDQRFASAPPFWVRMKA